MERNDTPTREELASRTRARLEQIEDLPAMPDVLLTIWDLAPKEETSGKQLGEALAKDPGLSAAVLRLANSSYFGFPRKVTTVAQAIVILGFNTVMGLAAGASAFRALRTESGGGLDPKRFYRHSLAVAAAARILVTRKGAQLAGPAFAAGILHDLGELVVAEYLSEAMPAIESLALAGRPYEEAEREILGITHDEVGAWFAGRWNLPPELTTAIGWHHRPGEAPAHKELVAAVHLGDVVAYRVDAGRAGRIELPEPSAAASEILALTDTLCEEITERVGECVSNAGPAEVALGV
jgi:HD-like signal output (HDOD) protein